jgi:hypothetical protein
MAFVAAPFSAPRRAAHPAAARARPAIRMGRKRVNRAVRAPGPQPGPATPSPSEPTFPPATPVEPPVERKEVESVDRPDAPQSVQYAPDADLPVVDESMLRLPDAPGAARGAGVRRRRRRKASEGEEEGHDTAAEEEAAGLDGDDAGGMFGLDKIMRGSVVPGVEDDRSAVDAVRKLTAEFRKGSARASDVLLREMEKDPDFLFQTGNGTGEYDLTSAVIGTGSPNEQGVYVLPYLQSGHVLLLLVILLCAFVYYPGFPLTELDEGTTDWLKRGLAVTYAFNAGLAVLSYGEAKRRAQPPLFWAFKTAFLGGLAFSELRANVPTEEERTRRAAGRKRKRGGKQS